MTEDVREINRRAWDLQVERGDRWTVPVSPEVIAAARRGSWSVLLTNLAPVPRRWFPADLRGVSILGLAAAGGQQGPILAAAGARVTIFDNSPRQLAQDRLVAQREQLDITTDEGDMRDLSRYADGSFDIVFNPCSVLFVPEVRPVWRECFRALKPGGILMTGFLNPVTYLFDREKMEDGIFEARHRLPYSDLQLSAKQRAKLFGPDEPVEFSHTLTDLLGGQLAAGFQITDLYEDSFGDPRSTDPYFPGLIATRAIRPPPGQVSKP